MSGKAEVLHGNTGGAAGGDLGGITVGSADWLGLGGLVGGWTSLTRSSPDELDSLSDSRN